MNLQEVAPDEPRNSELLFVSFNQDFGCFACGTESGFRIYNVEPFKETFRRKFSGGGIGIVEMLFRCNLLALVGGGRSPRYPPNKVMIWDDHQSRCIGELSFRSEVRAVKLRRDRVVVALATKIYVYRFSDLKLLDQISTQVNQRGLVALCPHPAHTVLACPGVNRGHVRVELYDARKSTIVAAHESDLCRLALNADGSLVATASDKGTLVRVFDTRTGAQVRELRRGVDRAVVYSIAFDADSQYVACTSDKGTAHVFSIRGTPGSASSSSARTASGDGYALQQQQDPTIVTQRMGSHSGSSTTTSGNTTNARAAGLYGGAGSAAETAAAADHHHRNGDASGAPGSSSGAEAVAPAAPQNNAKSNLSFLRRVVPGGRGAGSRTGLALLTCETFATHSLLIGSRRRTSSRSGRSRKSAGSRPRRCAPSAPSRTPSWSWAPTAVSSCRRSRRAASASDSSSPSSSEASTTTTTTAPPPPRGGARRPTGPPRRRPSRPRRSPPRRDVRHACIIIIIIEGGFEDGVSSERRRQRASPLSAVPVLRNARCLLSNRTRDAPSSFVVCRRRCAVLLLCGSSVVRAGHSEERVSIVSILSLHLGSARLVVVSIVSVLFDTLRLGPQL